MTKKPTSKVDTVIALCKRKAGVSVSEISRRLSVSTVAASSLIPTMSKLEQLTPNAAV